ncbi:MAG TPA: RdgB/HAM1 family non-canonical purine NTP pyrophosphatase [Pyrinomonadaceae bacterium]|nr:RdgB/HAM1 family non-canonical purine NTP pyrophosphatase [Pyrinomonadaceae bacterium]
MTHGPQFELLAGTSNRGKIREIQDVLADLPIVLRSVTDFPGIPIVDEVGKTYEVNAALKALSYANWTSLTTLADDSGLEVDALDGMPGPFSARYGGDFASGSDRTRQLLSALGQKQTEPRTARFVCCLTLAGWDLPHHERIGEPVILKVSKGQIEGQIAKEPRGLNGFGYDPVFVPVGHEMTFAELPTALKNRISHRAQALAAMRTFLEDWVRQA